MDFTSGFYSGHKHSLTQRKVLYSIKMYNVFWTKIAFLLVYSCIHMEINIYYVTIIHNLVIFLGVLTKVTEQKHESQNLFSQ